MDTKKKELVGQFKNNGRVWSREPVPVQDHDFRSQAKGMAIPYGIYDLNANRGAVVVGTSHDTPAFAVEAICQWWRREGCHRYPKAPELLILADSGGSNGARCRAWKLALQENWQTAISLASRSVIIRRVLPSGTRSSTAFSARSANIGADNP